ncbi:MAG TPA: PQQ-binding-like beta-propeller repeat protein [Nocardioides sp.]|nr:PQQ-binding-like beta-propeller repeat protein [Nocardioides sp.]
MTSPEQLHADLTSGNLSTITTMVLDVRVALRNVDGATDHIRYAADVPTWESPSARTKFNALAWANAVVAQMGVIRLNQAKLALDRVAADYQWVVHQADNVLDWWNQYKRTHTTDDIWYLVVRLQVQNALVDLRTSYGKRISSALTHLTGDPLSADQREWLEHGLVRSLIFDLSDPTDIGPTIPDSVAGGADADAADDDDLTQQGLGVDPATGNLLQTSYTKNGEAVLSVIDPDTGEVIRTVNLGAADGGSAPDHAGGVSVDNGTVYVSSSGKDPDIYSYSLDDIMGSAPGDTVPVQGTQGVEGGAYSTVHDGVLYVGTHNEDGNGELFTYVRDDRGQWVRTGDTYESPPKAQGIAVRDGVIYFTSSLGRGNDSMLYAYDAATGRQIGVERLPNMAEGVVATDDGIVVTYESGSGAYDTPGGVPSDDLWASRNLTITPYSEFGLGEDTEVRPETLRAARVSFLEAEAALDRTIGEIHRLSLPASALGKVPQAPAFATALDAHLDKTARWLDKGKITATLNADGLVATALDYERTDDGLGGLIDNLTRFAIRLGGG